MAPPSLWYLAMSALENKYIYFIKLFTFGPGHHHILLFFLTPSLSVRFSTYSSACFSGSSLLPLESSSSCACLGVFTRHDWTAVWGFSSEIGLYSDPCHLSPPPPAFVACSSHRITSWPEETSLDAALLFLIVCSPSWPHLSSQSHQPTCLQGHSGAYPAASSLDPPVALWGPEHFPSPLLPTQILTPLKTCLTSPWLTSTISQPMLFVRLAPHSTHHAATKCCSSRKSKATSPRLSEGRRRAGGREYPTPWLYSVLGPWKPLSPLDGSWIAFSLVRLTFTLKF